jgi:MFS family permease
MCLALPRGRYYYSADRYDGATPTMNIHEPATLISDLVLAAVSASLAIRLRRMTRPDNRPARAWVWTLAIAALSSALGGFSHGFGPELPAWADALLWRMTLWTLSLAAAAMAWSLVDELFAPEGRRGWRVAIVAKAAVFIGATALTPQFVLAIADYGGAMLAWLVASAACRRAWRGWFAAGVGVSVIAAVVQQAGPDLAVHFNHNDLYHLIQIGALWLLYRGARLLGGR